MQGDYMQLYNNLLKPIYIKSAIQDCEVLMMWEDSGSKTSKQGRMVLKKQKPKKKKKQVWDWEVDGAVPETLVGSTGV